MNVGERCSPLHQRLRAMVAATFVAASVAVTTSVAVVATAEPAAAVSVPPGFQEEIVFSGLTEPTAVRFSADGRVFVAEKSGVIKIFDGLTDAYIFGPHRQEVQQKEVVHGRRRVQVRAHRLEERRQPDLEFRCRAPA